PGGESGPTNTEQSGAAGRRRRLQRGTKRRCVSTWNTGVSICVAVARAVHLCHKVMLAWVMPGGHTGGCCTSRSCGGV
ncbi:hypothetical protein GBAR_LOCUS18046, partial [Geodia barretti]